MNGIVVEGQSKSLVTCIYIAKRERERERERERAILSKILSSRSLSYSHDYSAPWGMILTNWAALRFNSLSLLSNSSLVANVSSYFGLIPISSFQFIFFVLFTEKRSSSVPNVSPRPRFSCSRSSLLR